MALAAAAAGHRQRERPVRRALGGGQAQDRAAGRGDGPGLKLAVTPLGSAPTLRLTGAVKPPVSLDADQQVAVLPGTSAGCRLERQAEVGLCSGRASGSGSGPADGNQRVTVVLRPPPSVAVRLTVKTPAVGN